MFSRYIKSGILTLIAISFVAGCSALVQASDALTGVYVYEKAGFGGEFTTTLNSMVHSNTMKERSAARLEMERGHWKMGFYA